MRLDRTRHSDRSEQERDETNKIQEPVKIVERFAQIFFAFRDRIVLEPGLLDLRREFFHLGRHINAGRELHEIEIAREAARLEQISPRQVLQWNVNPWRKARRRRGFSRHFGQCTRDFERRLSNFDRIAWLRPELKKQTLFRHRFAAVPKRLRGDRRRGFHFAVEREVAAERADGDQPRAPAFRKERHGPKTHLARLGFA